jgi:hypothetical protein
LSLVTIGGFVGPWIFVIPEFAFTVGTKLKRTAKEDSNRKTRKTTKKRETLELFGMRQPLLSR